MGSTKEMWSKLVKIEILPSIRQDKYVNCVIVTLVVKSYQPKTKLYLNTHTHTYKINNL